MLMEYPTRVRTLPVPMPAELKLYFDEPKSRRRAIEYAFAQPDD